jgi:hypothetical protein
MSRSALRLSAVILTTLIIITAAIGLDHLPSDVRAKIDAERVALASAQTQLHTAQDQVTREVQSESAFFLAVPGSQQWPARFDGDAKLLQSASSDVSELSRLEQRGHHRDRDRAESLLAHERRLRTTALADASGMEQEAARWLDRKQHLPQLVQEMERDYRAIHAFDLAPLTGTIQRAQADWPEKKADLDSRLAAERAIVTDSDGAWESSAAVRGQAALGSTGLDYALLFTAADSLKTAAAELPKRADELKSLTAQLYDSWDKVLVDMEVRGAEYNQKLRTVRTHAGGATTSDEQWVYVSKATYQAMQNHLGMAIEHKPAGKFDSEAEHVPQPAGFAYVAPPSQGSNQYGYWDHRGGQSFWVFYGQYALLRDLLFNHQYQPVNRGEWESYRTSQERGHTYYGQDTNIGSAPKYGTQGTATQDRYSGTTYAKGGGFRDSQYASKSGGYRDSKYSSPSIRDPNADHNPKTFGRTETHAAPPAQHSYHPAPAPSRAPSRSPGRSFGNRHR